MRVAWVVRPRSVKTKENVPPEHADWAPFSGRLAYGFT